MICDFCSGELPVCSYQLQDFEMLRIDDVALVSTGGGWAACAACRDPIEANDRVTLLERAVSALQTRQPDLFARRGEGWAREFVSQQQATFFAHRREG